MSLDWQYYEDQARSEIERNNPRSIVRVLDAVKHLKKYVTEYKQIPARFVKNEIRNDVFDYLVKTISEIEDLK